MYRYLILNNIRGLYFGLNYIYPYLPKIIFLPPLIVVFFTLIMLFVLILPYFAFILPFLPFSLPFFHFLSPSSFFFYIFSFFLPFSYFPPRMTSANIPPGGRVFSNIINQTPEQKNWNFSHVCGSTTAELCQNLLLVFPP